LGKPLCILILADPRGLGDIKRVVEKEGRNQKESRARLEGEVRKRSGAYESDDLVTFETGKRSTLRIRSEGKREPEDPKERENDMQTLLLVNQ